MPYYGNNPADQYQGTAFNPYTGRLSGAQLVMQFLARQQADKQRKQQEQWDLEDRLWETATMRPLQKEQAETSIESGKLGVKKQQQEVDSYVSPELQRFLDRIDEKRKHKQDLEKIEATGKQQRATVAARPTTRQPLGFDSAYQYASKIKTLLPEVLKEIAKVEKAITAEEKETGAMKMFASSAKNPVFQERLAGLASTKDRRKALHEYAKSLRQVYASLQAGEEISLDERMAIEELLSVNLLDVAGGEQESSGVPEPPPGFKIIK